LEGVEALEALITGMKRSALPIGLGYAASLPVEASGTLTAASNDGEDSRPLTNSEEQVSSRLLKNCLAPGA
jgi:hypothetical protein